MLMRIGGAVSPFVSAAFEAADGPTKIAGRVRVQSTTVASSPGIAVALAPQLAVARLAASEVAYASPVRMPSAGSTAGGCGAEPARKQVGMTAPFVDAAAGAAWLACKDRENAARQAAGFSAIDHAAGCGPEPAFNLASSGQKFYTDAELGAHWQACRAALPTSGAGQPASSISTPVPVNRGALTQAPSGGSGGSGGSSSSSPTPTDPGGLQQTPFSVSGSVDVPSEVWIGLGVLAAATVLGGIFLATRHWQEPKKRAA